MNTPLVPESGDHMEAPRQLRLRYAGICNGCGKNIAKGGAALYDAPTRTVRCIACESGNSMPGGPVEALHDAGTAGASSRREYERRKSARGTRVKNTLGNFVGGVVLAMTDEPQSTRAWARGAMGEQKLAEALDGVPDLKILHDRRVPETRGNVDHIVVAPAGVFVVDAKFYKGLIRIRDVGGLFKTDKRLYVGSRDCSHLAENMGWQVKAVLKALVVAGFNPTPPITPVLCFVDGDWPLLSRPEEHKGIRLEGKRSIKKLVTGMRVLDAEVIDRIYRALAMAFPPK